MEKAPKMPDEYKGEVKRSGGFTKTAPRDWTEQELEWVKAMIDQGYSRKEIAESIDRTPTSVAIKLKRISKKNRTYNAAHIEDKYETNHAFIETVKPSNCIDVFAGRRSVYSDRCDVIANDKDPDCDTDYHLDALKFCCKMYEQDQRADIVDLDPFGSAYDCFDLAVKMANKGLAITFGELGHKRWKRLDFVRRYYGIEDLESFTLDALIAHVQAIGRRNKKELTVFAKKEWHNIGRVWFTIEPLKITEQWSEGKELEEWML